MKRTSILILGALAGMGLVGGNALMEMSEDAGAKRMEVRALRAESEVRQLRRQLENERGVCYARVQIERQAKDVCETNLAALARDEEALEHDLERCRHIR